MKTKIPITRGVGFIRSHPASELLKSGRIWANDPVPLFPYPGSPDYRRLWGVPDDSAWEHAVSCYLGRYGTFSDIQDQQPRPLDQLERMDAA